jgi:type VI secretion system protein ImpJ
MIPEKQIFWHQGLFLQPQHFQQAERIQQSLLAPLYQYGRPYCWGIREVSINEAALLNRVVELNGLEAVFQDFSWVVGGENGTLPSRSFAELEDAFSEGEALLVYVGLRRWDRAGVNVTRLDNKAPATQTRYISREDPVTQKDLYDSGPVAKIRFLEHNLRIFWQSETENAGEFHLLPILRLVMNGESIVPDKSFVPPPLTLDSSHHLLQLVKNIMDQMQARARVLETYKPLHGTEINSLEKAALYYLLALNTLNRYAAQLQHHLRHPVIHPWQLYGILAQLAGELSTFSDRVNGLAQLRDGTSLLSGYDHLEAGRSFSEMQQLVTELLEAIVVGSENILIMTRRDDRFSCDFPPELLAKKHVYCLMVRTSAPEEEVVNLLLHHVKVGSCSEVDVLLTRSLAGVSLSYQEIPPLGIVRRQGCYYFEINTDHPRWQQVLLDGNLCVHWDQAPEDTAMELMVTRL